MSRRKAVKLWTWRRMLRDHGPENTGLLLTLHTIGTWMDADGFCYPGQKEIAAGARVSVRTVKRHLSDAVDLGWLHVESVALPHKGQGWRRNEYYATVPAGVELGDVDEEITDCLHSQCGDVGEDYQEGGDTILSPRYVTDTEKVGTSDAKVGTPVTEGGDTGRHKVGTQLCPHNSSLNSSKNSSVQKGAPDGAPPAFRHSENHWRASEKHEQPTGMSHILGAVQDSDAESLQGVSDLRRDRIRQLAELGYATNAIARMANMPAPAVEAVLSEDAA